MVRNTGYEIYLCGTGGPKWTGTGIRNRCDFIGKDNVALVLGDNIFYGLVSETSWQPIQIRKEVSYMLTM